MDTVTVDGKVYMKAAKAADEVGYTADYVGQLCRKGTLEGIMLGKTWYVREESLLAHKQSQPRANTVTTRRDIEKQKTASYEPHKTSLHGTMANQREYRKHLLETNIRYSTDKEELLPALVATAPVVAEIPALGDHQVSERDEEMAVPIRKMPSMPQSTSGSEDRDRSIGQSPLLLLTRPPEREFSFRSLVPVASLVVLLFLAANIVLESTWQYTDPGAKKAQLQTTYNLASLASITESLKTISF